MANFSVNSVPSWIQYTATASQTEFTVPFPFILNADIYVWQDGVLLAETTDYTLTGANTASGGLVTLLTGATVGDIITIEDLMVIDRTSIYSAVIANLTGSALNNDFNRDVLMIRRAITTQDYLQLQYAPYADISQDIAITRDRLLPILDAGSSWRMNAGGTAIENFELPDIPVGIDGVFTADNRLVKTDLPAGDNFIQQTTVELTDANILQTTAGSFTVASAVDLTLNPLSNLILQTGGTVSIDGTIWPTTTGAEFQVPRFKSGSSTEMEWVDILSVTLPVLDNHVARFDGTIGAIQESLAIIDDVGAFSGITSIFVDNLFIDGNTIISTDTDGAINLVPDGTGEINLASDVVIIEQAIQHSGDLNNQFIFGTDTQDFQTGGVSRMDISDAGVRLGAANSRVTTILDEDNMVSDSATALATQQSIKAYVDSSIGSGAGGSNGQIQYNNAGAFGGDSITTNGSGAWSGTLSLTGQLNVDNLRMDGNTLSSTDVNGNILLAPNGTGNVTIMGQAWNSLTNGQLWIGNTGSVPTAATLTAGAGMSITNAGGSITLASGGGSGFSWNYVSGTTTALAAGNGYITDNVALVTATLPVTCARGQGFALQNVGAGLLRIAQNAGQSIHFGSGTSTVGAGGYIEITTQFNGFIMLCTVADTEFCLLTPPNGAVTIV